MITTLIISDLHLDPAYPDDYSRVKSILTRESFDQLWILGDLFEAWVGDDGAEPPDLALAEFLKTHPSPVYWVAGNRDFLVGERFSQCCGWHELKPVQVLGCGLHVLVRHGDEWCTEDAAYQAFRKEVRSKTWQSTFLAQPLEQRRGIAQEMRRESRQRQKDVPLTLLDVTEDTIQEEASACGAQLVIHGHTHRPQLHHTPAYLRAVTSDWHDTATILRLTDTVELCRVEQVLCTAETHVVQATATWQVGSPEWNLN